jgi:hypothetical protein
MSSSCTSTVPPTSSHHGTEHDHHHHNADDDADDDVLQRVGIVDAADRVRDIMVFAQRYLALHTLYLPRFFVDVPDLDVSSPVAEQHTTHDQPSTSTACLQATRSYSDLSNGIPTEWRTYVPTLASMTLEQMCTTISHVCCCINSLNQALSLSLSLSLTRLVVTHMQA